MLRFLEKFDCDTYDLSDQLWRNQLEVDYEAFDKAMESKDAFSKLFDKVHKNYVIWLAKRVGLKEVDGNKSEVLVNVFESFRDNELVKLTALLLLFFKDKRKEALLESAKIILGYERYNEFMELEVADHHKLLLVGLFAYQEDYNKLVLWLQLAKSHTGGFTECTVIPDVEDELENIKLKKKIEKGLLLSLDKVSKNDFNVLLQAIERRRNSDQKESVYVCHQVIGNDLHFYCLRNTKRVMIREIEDTVWANDTELIILEFVDSFRKLRQRSTKGFGQDIASELVSHFSGTPVRYIPATNASGIEAAQEFINTLIEEKDKHFQFRELYVEETNLEEAPLLIIRWNGKQQIGSAVRELVAQFGLSLLDLSKIEYIKVGFQTEEESDKTFHQFIIYFNKFEEDRVMVTFSTTFALKQKRDEFVKVLN